MKSRRGPRSRLAIAASVLVLLVGGVMTYNVEGARHHAAEVQRANERVRVLDDLERGVIGAETGQRGYLITGEAEYLKPYHESLEQIRDVRRAVRDLGLPDADVRQLDRLVDSKFEELAYTLKLFDSADRQRAAEFVKQDTGKRTMDRIRVLIAKLKQSEEALRQQALVRQQQRMDVNQLIAAGGGVLAFLIALMAQLGLRKEVEEHEAQADRFRTVSELLSDQADQLKLSEIELAARLRRQHELTAQLTQHATSLERANKELDQFAYVASHDLKAPLRGIASLAAFIEEDAGPQLDEESRENLGLLQQRVKRMEALIEGMLIYARAARRTEPELLDTGDLVRDVVDLLNPGETVSVHVAADLPSLETSRAQLQQVLMNLIDNAIKHGNPDNCVVNVSAAPDSGGWRFSVADNGPGIDARYHERVFGFFERLRSRDDVEGSGIGLAVVKKVAEDRGGRVWIESVPGAGATFHVLWLDPEQVAKTGGEDE